MDAFIKQYLVTILFAENDNSTPSGGEPLDKNYSVDDFSPEAIQKATDDCNKFHAENKADLDLAYELYVVSDGSPVETYAAHDFWLTRNGHGAGFWDRGLGDVGDRLTEASHKFGEQSAYVGDDGVIHLS